MAKSDILPYIIVFAILFIVNLGVLTWALGVYFKSENCAIHPNIWCSDTWTCNNSCSNVNADGDHINLQGVVVSKCFGQIGATGLASCLYGPKSTTAQICYIPPTSGNPHATSCDCVTPMQNANNCFNSCPSSLNDVNASVNCCCKGPNCKCPSSN